MASQSSVVTRCTRSSLYPHHNPTRSSSTCASHAPNHLAHAHAPTGTSMASQSPVVARCTRSRFYPQTSFSCNTKTFSTLALARRTRQTTSHMRTRPHIRATNLDFQPNPNQQLCCTVYKAMLHLKYLAKIGCLILNPERASHGSLTNWRNLVPQ
jgi:hypothetical protein